METPQAEPFFIPPFLMVLCMMSAMSFMLGAAYWLWRKGREGESFQAGLDQIVWRFQFYSALAVIAVFTVLNLLFTMRAGSSEEIVIGPEAFVLFFSGALFAFHCHREGTPILPAMTREIKRIGLPVLAVLTGWFVTLVVGWSLGALLYRLYMASDGKTGDIGILAPMITGALWMAPLYALYRRWESPEVKFHDVLWPLVFAYLVLLVPLQIEHTVGSPEWFELKAARPPLKSA